MPRQFGNTTGRFLIEFQNYQSVEPIVWPHYLSGPVFSLIMERISYSVGKASSEVAELDFFRKNLAAFNQNINRQVDAYADAQFARSLDCEGYFGPALGIQGSVDGVVSGGGEH